jgi:hypothetical protein
MGSIQYFAHNGVEHATAAEATAHKGPATSILLFGLTVLVVCLGVLAIYLLSTPSKTRSISTKSHQSKRKT